MAMRPVKHFNLENFRLYGILALTLYVQFTEPVAPTIVIQSNTTEPLSEGNTAYLVCIAVGVSYPSIHWYKDDELITRNGSLTSVYDETSEHDTLLFTTSILELCSLKGNDTGTYSCIAMNEAGNSSTTFDVQINPGK